MINHNISRRVIIPGRSVVPSRVTFTAYETPETGAIANMAAFAPSNCSARASAPVSGLNFQPWPEILKRVVCDVVCMQIRPSGNGDGAGRRRVGEGQFPSGASRVALVTADIARACAPIRVHVYPLDARVRVYARA